MKSFGRIDCQYLETCRGCPLGGLEFEEQTTIKKNRLLNRLKGLLDSNAFLAVKFDFKFPVHSQYRIRTDFTYLNGRLGWYDRAKVFLPIESCPLHAPELTNFIRTVAQVNWPVKKGSFRFRVGHLGIKGLWLDLANLDIKTVLSNQEILNYLFENNIVVEMGQKGKRVQTIAGEFKLTEPTPEPWFSTQFQEKTVPLLALISSFTQTNPDLNLKMIGVIDSFLNDLTFTEIVEFGCGVGNFTLYLTEKTKRVSVIENDFKNLVALEKNLALYKVKSSVVVYENLNHFIKRPVLTEIGPDGCLFFVNPSRSGVGTLFDSQISANSVLYVSCHLESFLIDSAKLVKQGFKLSRSTLFDQFPHSEHFEIISFFTK